MQKERPAILREMSLKEYILVFKYFMKKKGCTHVAGFVNAPMLYAKPDGEELQKILRDAMMHETLIQEGERVDLNPVIYTFINAWTHSKNIVMLKKFSYGDGQAIAFARVEGFYLVAWQNVKNDKVTLMADSEWDFLYAYLESEIKKGEPNKKFELQKVNQLFQEQGRDIRLEVDPATQLVLQCINNREGAKIEADVLINVGKKQFELIRLDRDQKVESVEKKENETLKDEIRAYIDRNCPVDPTEGKRDSHKTDGDFAGNKGGNAKDPEYYTRLSFQNLTRNAQFPKSFWGFLKLMIVNFVKGFLSWKNLLIRVGVTLILSIAALVWNLYALCYLNDTFNIGKRAVFGKATAYLQAGIADTHNVIGIPKFSRYFNSVTITALLYYLLSIVIVTIIRDVLSGKVKTNVKHFFSFGSEVKRYCEAAPDRVIQYIYTGLAAAAVLNIVVFNPFTVFLLALMILFSCMKCEDGGIAPFLMMLASSTGYKRIVEGKRKVPLFGHFQLGLLGLSVGLIFCTLINAGLWFAVDFNFWIRLAISVVILLFVLFKKGIIRIDSTAAKVSVFVGIIGAQISILLMTIPLITSADDGGWSESGGTLAGLMNNSGWPTILAFSLILALAAAIGCVTFGLGTAAVLGVAGATFGSSAIWATFTETGRLTAYDFVLGKYSPYADVEGIHTYISTGLSIGISVIAPGFGDALGFFTGLRDCTFDIQKGDWIGLAFDGIGLGMDCYGVYGDIKGVVARHADDAAKAVARHADDMAETATRYADDVAEAVAHHADDVAKKAANNSNEYADRLIKELEKKAIFSEGEAKVRKGVDEVRKVVDYVNGNTDQPDFNTGTSGQYNTVPSVETQTVSPAHTVETQTVSPAHTVETQTVSPTHTVETASMDLRAEQEAKELFSVEQFDDAAHPDWSYGVPEITDDTVMQQVITPEQLEEYLSTEIPETQIKGVAFRAEDSASLISHTSREDELYVMRFMSDHQPESAGINEIDGMPEFTYGEGQSITNGAIFKISPDGVEVMVAFWKDGQFVKMQ